MNRRLIALRLTGLGWYVASCIVAGVLGGVWLDKLLGLEPLFTLLGVLLGTVAAFYGLFKMVRPLINGKNQGDNFDSNNSDISDPHVNDPKGSDGGNP